MKPATHRHTRSAATALRRGRLIGTAVLLALALPTAAGALSEAGPDPNPAPGGCRILAEDGVVRFPFDIYRGDIRFRAEINGHEVHLLLDDGFMWDPLLFWGGPEVDALGLERDGEVSLEGSAKDTAIASNTASGITLRLPGVEFTDQTAVITPASSGNSTMWAGSIGQVSATFFKHFVVDINFDTMMITLIDPESFEYRGDGVAVPWRPLAVGAWSIPGTLRLADGREVSLELMMDLGYNDQAQIATGGEHGFTAPEKALPGSLGFNIQREETRGHFGRVPGIEIGGVAVKDVIAGFVSEEHSDHTFHEVMIGLGLLSRFNLVFDSTRHSLFVEPNNSFARPFEYNMSGLSLRKNRQDVYEVVRVHPDSPAAAAGLKTGDTVTEINRRQASGYDYWGLTPLFQQEGEVVDLIVVRDGKELEVSLTLRRLI